MNSLKVLNLNIGEIIVTDELVTINTTLGSCVSICLFSNMNNACGMIHYALPYFLQTSMEEDMMKYGEYAIPELIKRVSELAGLRPSQLKAKIVGGANCFIRTSKGGMDNIGESNINVGLKILEEYKIEVVGEHLGGPVGRKVIFHTTDGRLQVASLKVA